MLSFGDITDRIIDEFDRNLDHVDNLYGPTNHKDVMATYHGIIQRIGSWPARDLEMADKVSIYDMKKALHDSFRTPRNYQESYLFDTGARLLPLPKESTAELITGTLFLHYQSLCELSVGGHGQVKLVRYYLEKLTGLVHDMMFGPDQVKNLYILCHGRYGEFPRRAAEELISIADQYDPFDGVVEDIGKPELVEHVYHIVWDDLRERSMDDLKRPKHERLGPGIRDTVLTYCSSRIWSNSERPEKMYRYIREHLSGN